MPRKIADIPNNRSASCDPTARAIRMQVREIIAYRNRLADDSGRHLSLDDAAREWIHKHAADWRRHFNDNDQLDVDFIDIV